MEITPKTPWKERRIKDGSINDRKLTADCIRIGRVQQRRIRNQERSTEHNAFMVAVCVLIGALLILISVKAHAADINMDIIAEIESSNEPLAYNKGHVGIYQISQGVVTDYNYFNKSRWELNSMYEPINAFTIGNWFINVRIPQELNIYRIPDTPTARLIAWNWGIGHLRKWFKHGSHWNRLPMESRNYIKKYFKEIKK